MSTSKKIRRTKTKIHMAVMITCDCKRENSNKVKS